MLERGKLKHIELFAGCGGMTLGLEAAGFDLFFANEISPMASETFAYNLLNEDLSELGKNNQKSEKVLWIKSKYNRNDLTARLKENPYNSSNGNFCDIDNLTEIDGRLIIGDINQLLNYFEENGYLRQIISNSNIDVLSGGPPCQGFSLAGKRIRDDKKNLLPLSFAKFAGIVQPKIVVLENVKGITHPFKSDNGKMYHAYLEVAKAFSLEGFIPICMLLNSKYFGVPQNRPRFILFAFRKDIYFKIKSRSKNSDFVNRALSTSYQFFCKVNENTENLDVVKTKDIGLFNIEENPEFFNGDLLPRITNQKGNFISVYDAINDIKSSEEKFHLDLIKNNYSNKLTNLFNRSIITKEELLDNHEPRKHAFQVKARFRVYQLLNELNGIKQDVLKLLSGENFDEQSYLKIFKALKGKSLLLVSDGKENLQYLNDLQIFKSYFDQIKSKKQSQRALRRDEPAPSQLTIPDDMCHYSSSELRTLTVREMARLQSFPDRFVFRSKVTTGGINRAYEVPQYTQVGNAVPPLLAYELGNTIKHLLNSIE